MKNKAVELMKVLGGIFILTAIFELSKFLFSAAGIRFPAALGGMIALFILLLTGILPSKYVESACVFLMRNMLFMFAPFLIGITSYREMLEGKIIPMGSALLISTIITMALTALSIVFIDMLKKEPPQNEELSRGAQSEEKIR